MRAPFLCLAAALFSAAGLTPSAFAQDTLAQESSRRQAILARLPAEAAKRVFGLATSPAPGPARPIGDYTKGCVAGAVQLPADGPNWQVMRPSRNRAWGHPILVGFLQRLAATLPSVANWPGLLVGDIGQPRGGPMLTGHTSHQVGLDADIWLTPMPDRRLSREEREETSAVMMVRADRLDIDPSAWTPNHLAVIRAAAQEPSVQRIFVNAAIKKALCREARGDRSWLHKVRPMYGHDYHFHIRIKCPPGASGCESQPEPSASEGCKPADLAYWFKDSIIHPKPPKVSPKPKPPMTLAQLPAACRQVLAAPDTKP